MRPFIVSITGLSFVLGLLCFALDLLMRHFWSAAIDIFWIGVAIAAGVIAFKVHKYKPKK